VKPSDPAAPGGIRALARLALVAASVAACAGSPASPSPTAPEQGILMVNAGEQVQSKFTTEAVAQALSNATVLAEANGADLGYPWLDPGTGEIVLSVVTPHGLELVKAAGITLPHRTRRVSHGAAELQRIQDDVTFLHARGVPDSELIFATVPDHRDNRVLIMISAASPALLEYLASHYPADALAVEVDPGGGGGAPADAP